MTGFAAKYGRWAIIAGASEGIGACLADEIASRGVDLVLIARNGALLEDVAAGVRARHGVEVRTLVLDLTVDDVAERVAAVTQGLEIGLLVYNAGASDRTAEFLDNEFDYSLKQIKLDVVGPAALARQFGPAMRERGRGGIAIVASLACVAGSATLAMYSGVKAFQHNFAEGLWAELAPHGVDVVCTPLGMTWTPALERMGVERDEAAQMTADDVAREIVEHIGDGPVYVVGEHNRAIASQVWTIERRALVEMMSAASNDFAAKRKG